MPGAGLPQVSAGWVLMSWADAVPAPGSPRANRARVASFVCREPAPPACMAGRYNLLVLREKQHLELLRVKTPLSQAS